MGDVHVNVPVTVQGMRSDHFYRLGQRIVQDLASRFGRGDDPGAAGALVSAPRPPKPLPPAMAR